MTSVSTKWLGVIGWPIEHSRSPAIHTAAIEALGIDAVYLAFAVPEDELGAAVEGLRALGAIGANVTVPHKERVMAFLDRIEPPAQAIGAVNTIVRDGEVLIGTNTDAAGLVRSLEEEKVALDGANVLVIGAGGAARASVAAMQGAAHVDVAARRIGRAQRLVREIGGSPIDLNDAAAMRAAVERADVIVQATSATLGAGDPDFIAQIPLEAAQRHACVVDLVYAPERTLLIEAAAAHGLRTVGGLGMLVWQAALAFERWHGVAAPIDVMRRAAG